MWHRPCKNGWTDRTADSEWPSGEGSRNPVLDGRAHWRHSANTVERLCAEATSWTATGGGDAASSQITRRILSFERCSGVLFGERSVRRVSQKHGRDDQRQRRVPMRHEFHLFESGRNRLVLRRRWINSAAGSRRTVVYRRRRLRVRLPDG